MTTKAINLWCSARADCCVVRFYSVVCIMLVSLDDTRQREKNMTQRMREAERHGYSTLDLLILTMCQYRLLDFLVLAIFPKIYAKKISKNRPRCQVNKCNGGVYRKLT
jgi:hypothetical protein